MRRRTARVGMAALTVALVLISGWGRAAAPASGAAWPEDLAGWVDPFIGTDAVEHTFPGAATPFGLVQLSPDTGGDKGFYLLADWKWCAGYHYSDSSLLGFSHLHRSGMGVGDWGDILVAPTVGPLQTTPGDPDDPDSGYRSRFDHQSELARPGYYAVTLSDSGIRAELSATTRVGFHRYAFPASDSAHLLFDLGHGLGDNPIGGRVRVIGPDRIVGTRASQGRIPFQKVHFCAAFSRPFDSFGTWNGPLTMPGKRLEVGTKIGAFVNYGAEDGETVLVKVGVSYTSEQEACQNLEAELPGWDFDQTAANALAAWTQELSKIKVQPSSLDDPEVSRQRLAVFSTALYHAFLFPSAFSDHDGTYSPIGNAPGRSRRADGFTYYSDYSTWDTFRAQLPLLALVQPERLSDMIRSLIVMYQDSGWMPTPQQFGNYHTEGMIGDHNAAFILDAWLKGVRDFDLPLAYQAMRKNAMDPAINVISMDGFGVGRYGVLPYRALGYIPADNNIPHSTILFFVGYVFNQGASRTLEYAFDDFCLAWLAKELDRPEDQRIFMKRALYYKNLFDPQTGFIRGKSITGRWMNGKKFDPATYYAYYTEGNAWQYTWSVFHDVQGLIDLMGGRDAFNQKLDDFFSADQPASASELFSVHIGGMIGQYAHGNEPSHHAAYLYDFSGQPWKTQELVRRIMDEFYRPAPHGLAGNEDMGQMSAWYVFSALGLYPFCPGIYTIGSPLFDRVEVEMKDGARLIVLAENASMKNKYVQSARLNGKGLDRAWIAHAEIAAGATLEFVMGPDPNFAWASAPDAAPPSLDKLFEAAAPAAP